MIAYQVRDAFVPSTATTDCQRTTPMIAERVVGWARIRTVNRARAVPTGTPLGATAPVTVWLRSMRIGCTGIDCSGIFMVEDGIQSMSLGLTRTESQLPSTLW